jgi:coenzyme PQQ precursor peptide PqqA
LPARHRSSISVRLGVDIAHAHTSVQAGPIRRVLMSWKSPKIVEIALGAEIYSYACAEAKK